MEPLQPYMGYDIKPNYIGSKSYQECAGTSAPNYCILPYDQAVDLCNEDPNCSGYGYALNNPNWILTHPDQFQLFTGDIDKYNTDWVSYAKIKNSEPIPKVPLNAEPGYTMVNNTIGATSYPECPGTSSPNYCILPYDQAIDLCNEDPTCSGYGYAFNNSNWINSHPDQFQLFTGDINKNNSQWISYVKDQLSEPIPTPTSTYMEKTNTIGNAYPPCTGTQSTNYCILPKEQAIELCNEDPDCSGYGYAKGNTGWMNSYGDDYQLFQGTVNMKNNAWVSYVKQSETPYDQNLNNLPTMRLKSGNKCLDVNNNVYNDGNKVQIYDCNDTDAQKFIYDNGYLIAAGSLNNNNIQCVARYVDPTVDNYERVILNNCSYDPSQIWNIDGKLIKSPDGKCLDVPNGKYDNGVVPLLYTCNNGSNQMWERI
jgi:hypothetical protein